MAKASPQQSFRQEQMPADLMEQLYRDAVRQRDLLLKSRPELKGFQEEIDRLLNNAGNGRIAVMEILMESHLSMLHDQLLQLMTLFTTEK